MTAEALVIQSPDGHIIVMERRGSWPAVLPDELPPEAGWYWLEWVDVRKPPAVWHVADPITLDEIDQWWTQTPGA